MATKLCVPPEHPGVFTIGEVVYVVLRRVGDIVFAEPVTGPNSRAADIEPGHVGGPPDVEA